MAMHKIITMLMILRRGCNNLQIYQECPKPMPKPNDDVSILPWRSQKYIYILTTHWWQNYESTLNPSDVTVLFFVLFLLCYCDIFKQLQLYCLSDWQNLHLFWTKLVFECWASEERKWNRMFSFSNISARFPWNGTCVKICAKLYLLFDLTF